MTGWDGHQFCKVVVVGHGYGSSQLPKNILASWMEWFLRRAQQMYWLVRSGAEEA